MKRKLPASAVAALTLAFLLAGDGGALVAQPAAPEPDMVPVPDSIIARNVPPIPQERVADLIPYENLRGAYISDWHPTERRMLVATRFGESLQLHELSMPLGARTQITFYRDTVPSGAYRPNDPDRLFFALDEGGAENYQAFLLDRKTGKARRFTDGKHRYEEALWSYDGKLLTYVSNSRNGRDFDLYVTDPAVAGSERRVVELEGSWVPLDWSVDGKRILLRQGVSSTEAYLHAVDVATGALTPLTPKAGPDAPQVAWEGGRWSKDGRYVYTTTDKDGEFRRLVRLDPATGATTVVSGDVPWDVQTFELSHDGKVLSFFVNDDGVSRLHMINTATGRSLPTPELPPGVAGKLLPRPGSHEVGFNLSWARSPSDVYSYDPDTGRLARWTASEVGGLDTDTFAVPKLVRFPTFDKDEKGARRTIPSFIYRPPADRFPGKRPVYINIHGGPEAQSLPNFVGSLNYLINNLGVAVVYPNVRGSSGYGKSFLKLDNFEKREDAVKDIGALLDWIATQPDLDASRVMVTGNSYGGYMVLASLVHYGERLRCGYDAWGISNILSFLQNTQEYRRDQRRVEYGDERDPKMRQFLEETAPASRVDRINRPLLVAQGANDPRVPMSESDQIVAALQNKGVPVWYVVAKDEGHGFGKKSNADYLRVVHFEFVRRCLLGSGDDLAAPKPQNPS
ncbi:MAG TPA: prolyl oligopeptidase family serine peptidase [Thermoanaerobaculia bacterium]|nr:prolyl oligopeptidase family serine peptidase [Thermoanaerobaculia bacterium]